MKNEQNKREKVIDAAYAIFNRFASIGVRCGASVYYRLYADFVRSIKVLSTDEQQEHNISTICDGIEALLSMNFGDDRIFDEIFANAGCRQERRPIWLENLRSAHC